MGNQRSRQPPTAHTLVQRKVLPSAQRLATSEPSPPAFPDLARATRLGHHIAKVPVPPAGEPASAPLSSGLPFRRSRAASPFAPQPDRTGLPDDLKAGVEALSGLSLNAVQVHYDSPQPAKLGALASAQGTEIHVGPGQERHLPHEAWHVVQQAQGRVRPTTQLKGGFPLNDEEGLEREADAMGAKAMSGAVSSLPAGEGDRGPGGPSWPALPPVRRDARVAPPLAPRASAIQLELDREALVGLVGTARPALIQGGTLSLPRCLGKAYVEHDAVPGDLENAWMDRSLTKSLEALGALDPRVRQALVANPSFIEHLTALADRVWTPPIALAFREGLLAGLLPGDLTEQQLGESIQVMGVLPATQWKTDDFLTLDEVMEAARSSPVLEAAYGEHSSYVDLVRIRAFHAKLHPPRELETAPTPTAGARRARFSANTNGYGVPSTSPELELIFADPHVGEAMRQQIGEQRERSTVQFNRGEVVFVPVGNVANTAGEIEVRFARSSRYVAAANLTLDPIPVTGALSPEDAVPLFPDEGPSPEDVGQQALGDCYFLAALASIAQGRPAIIRDVVKDLGDGNYAVRFFKKQTLPRQPPSFKPEWVGVDSDVYVDGDGKPIYAKGNTALWPAIVEKAYAVWKGKGSYEGIGGGFSNDAFEHVLGTPAEKVDVQGLGTVEGALGTGTYSKQALELFGKVRSAIDSGGSVALDTKEWGTGGTGQSAGENTTDVPGLASSHAYSVFGTVGVPGRDKYLYVTVRNPWGHFGRAYTETGLWTKSLRPSAKEGGTFDLELSDLMRHASNLHFA